MCAVVYVVHTMPAYLVPDHNPTMSSVWQVLQYPVVWAALCCLAFAYTQFQALEPIASAVLSNAPYHLSVTAIGGLQCIFMLTALLTMAFNVRTYTYLGVQGQQLVGYIFAFFGSALMAPSHIFGFIPPSLTLFIIAQLLTGGGMGLIAMMQPLTLLRILWIKAGLTKKDLGTRAPRTMAVRTLCAARTGPTRAS